MEQLQRIDHHHCLLEKHHGWIPVQDLSTDIYLPTAKLDERFSTLEVIESVCNATDNRSCPLRHICLPGVLAFGFTPSGSDVTRPAIQRCVIS